MARTTEAEVQKILDTNLTSDQLTAFIEDANVYVTEYLEGEGISDGALTIIEKNLAAAQATSREPLLSSSTLDDIQESYLRDENPYLRTAIAYDPTGTVEDSFMEGRPKASFRVGEGYDDDLDIPQSS